MMNSFTRCYCISRVRYRHSSVFTFPCIRFYLFSSKGVMVAIWRSNPSRWNRLFDLRVIKHQTRLVKTTRIFTFLRKTISIFYYFSFEASFSMYSIYFHVLSHKIEDLFNELIEIVNFVQKVILICLFKTRYLLCLL